MSECPSKRREEEKYEQERSTKATGGGVKEGKRGRGEGRTYVCVFCVGVEDIFCEFANLEIILNNPYSTAFQSWIRLLTPPQLPRA